MLTLLRLNFIVRDRKGVWVDNFVKVKINCISKFGRICEY